MEQSDPTLLEMAFSLNETVQDLLKMMVSKGVLLAPEEIARKRMTQCIACEFFKNDEFIPSRCMKCGCGMKIKTRLQAAHCPIAKW